MAAGTPISRSNAADLTEVSNHSSGASVFGHSSSGVSKLTSERDLNGWEEALETQGCREIGDQEIDGTSAASG